MHTGHTSIRGGQDVRGRDLGPEQGIEKLTSHHHHFPSCLYQWISSFLSLTFKRGPHGLNFEPLGWCGRWTCKLDGALAIARAQLIYGVSCVLFFSLAVIIWYCNCLYWFACAKRMDPTVYESSGSGCCRAARGVLGPPPLHHT